MSVATRRGEVVDARTMVTGAFHPRRRGSPLAARRRCPRRGGDLEEAFGRPGLTRTASSFDALVCRHSLEGELAVE